MFKPSKDFDFPQRPLAIGLVFKRRYFLYGHLCFLHIVYGGPAEKNSGCNNALFTNESTATAEEEKYFVLNLTVLPRVESTNYSAV